MEAPVRIRIAVRYDEDGNWAACGYSGASDKDMLATATDCVPGNGEEFQRCFVECEIPAWVRPLTVEGEVKP